MNFEKVLAQGRLYRNKAMKWYNSKEAEKTYPDDTERYNHAKYLAKQWFEADWRWGNMLVEHTKQDVDMATATKDNCKVQNKWFLTIRPRDELSTIHFVSFTNKLFTKRIFKNADWVYEQNGTTNESLGKGKHFHAICEMNSASKGKKYFLTEIQNFVKKEGLGDFIYDNCIDFKKINTDKDLHNKEEYIRTDRFCKSTEEKEDSWRMNELWRTNNNIDAKYSTREASPSNSPTDTLTGA